MDRVEPARRRWARDRECEDSLGAGGRALHGRHHAAHRIQAAVEAADVGDEHGQHADGQIRIVETTAKTPKPHDDQQAPVGQQRDHRLEERPEPVLTRSLA
jgi:hypothetical protein